LKIFGIDMDSTVTDRQACFQFKTSFSPCTILRVTRYDLDELAQQIHTAISKAPNFFLGSPVIIDLEAIKAESKLDFSRLKQILHTNNLVPVGVRGGSEEQHQAAATAGVPLITVGQGKPMVVPQPKKAAAVVAPVKLPTPISTPTLTKLVTTPIRSGMSIYAKDADLIVIAPVSAGAELLADGNIHVYGPLRGRALAGVQGNTQARIFCRTLEAELVAIAGYYLVKEDMHNLPNQESTVQIFLDNDQVRIESV
jgi:septum site-determining protein MinC